MENLNIALTELKKIDNNVVIYKYNEKYYCLLNNKMYRLFLHGPYSYRLIKV